MNTATILWRDLLRSVRFLPLLALLPALPLSAEVPSLINYQGRLTDAQGNPVTGNRTMAVRVYDAATGGNLTYQETIGSIEVRNGTYRFGFGASGNGLAAVLTGADYLALSVNGTEETTRTRLLAVPFALRSEDAQGLVAQSKLLSLSGNLVFGNGMVNVPLQRNLTITNEGFLKLTVAQISLPNGFSGNWSGVLAPGASQNVTITFTPTLAQAYGGNLTVQSDATGGGGSMPVSGTGTNSTASLFVTQAIPGGIRITGYSGTVPSNLVIPLTINGSPVLEIGVGAFQSMDGVSNLTLPTSLRAIGAHAFRDCDNLATVFIPASVTSIGTGAFAACDRLATIQVDITNGAYGAQEGVLYDLVSSAGNAILLQYPAGRSGTMFFVPSSLATGEPVIAIADRAFEEAQNLESMEFTNSVGTIGAGAFANAPRLAQLIFDIQISSIGSSAFAFSGSGALVAATFLGNAPASFGANVFSGASAGFEVRFLQGSIGFSAPTWTPSAGQTYSSRVLTSF